MTIARSLLWPGLCLVLWLIAGAARAALTIEITGGDKEYPIAIAALAGQERLPASISEVVGGDLVRSGRFRLIDAGGVTPPPVEPGDVRYGEWNSRGANALVIGQVVPLPDGRFEIRFRLMDVAKQSQIAGHSIVIPAAAARRAAHRIADIVYEALTGDVGVFSTRIAYVLRQGGRYQLQIADSDGHNPHSVLTSNEPIISPAWSPDGTRIAYVSFQAKKPIVYVQALNSDRQQVVANFKGSNSAPAWSPDGRRLAVVLTKDGSSQVYLVNADGGGLSRLTNSSGIDTEPAFSPDGQWVLFTSDRGGSPQIYRVRASGGEPERLTFEGSYNVTPRPSPDGRSFAFVQRSGGRFQLMTQDYATRAMTPITEGGVDESPSFAPNGKMLLYASAVRGRGILGAVSSDGRVKQRITVESGDVREPAWGPLLKGN